MEDDSSKGREYNDSDITPDNGERLLLFFLGVFCPAV